VQFYNSYSLPNQLQIGKGDRPHNSKIAIASPLFTDYLYQRAIAFLISYRERSLVYEYLRLESYKVTLACVCSNFNSEGSFSIPGEMKQQGDRSFTLIFCSGVIAQRTVGVRQVKKLTF
jgi:hypothetical protein